MRWQSAVPAGGVLLQNMLRVVPPQAARRSRVRRSVAETTRGCEARLAEVRCAPQ
jgi:hypothetical protein